MTTGVILAGGKNTRYPTLKGFIKVSGQTIIERNISLLRQVFSTVLISANDPMVYAEFALPVVQDEFLHYGPLSGIHACLKFTKQPIFVLTCDMPFVQIELIRLLKSLFKPNYDAVVPVFNAVSQPTLAIYNYSILQTLTDKLKKHKTSPQKFLREINTLFVPEDTFRHLDPQGRSFISINTPEDYERFIGLKS